MPPQKKVSKKAEEKQAEQKPEKQAEQKPQSDESESKEELSPYRPKHQPLQNAGLDQHALEKEREAQREAQRKVHNQRVGDASR